MPKIVNAEKRRWGWLILHPKGNSKGLKIWLFSQPEFGAFENLKTSGDIFELVTTKDKNSEVFFTNQISGLSHLNRSLLSVLRSHRIIFSNQVLSNFIIYCPRLIIDHKKQKNHMKQGSAQAKKVGSRLRSVTQKRNQGRFQVTSGYAMERLHTERFHGYALNRVTDYADPWYEGLFTFLFRK